MANHDGDLAPLIGALSSNAEGDILEHVSAQLVGKLSATALASQYQAAALGTMNGTLSATAKGMLYKDASCSMFGVLNCSVYSEAMCIDGKITMTTLVLKNKSCSTKGQNMKITRFRGDTYPLVVALEKDGSTNMTGMLIKMSVVMEDEVVHTFDGVWKYPLEGIAEFSIPAVVVNTVGRGAYDIQGEDTYVYTFFKGDIEIKADITP